MLQKKKKLKKGKLKIMFFYLFIFGSSGLCKYLCSVHP